MNTMTNTMTEEQNEPTTETPKPDNPPPPAAAVKPKKKKRETKADRLQNAAQAVLDAIEEAGTELQELADAYTAAQSAYEEIRSGLEGTLQGIEDALQNLRDVRDEEYQGWYDNLNEGLQQSPTGQKLDELLNIDLDPSMPELMELPDFEELDMSAVESAAQEILDADLPQGFGRD
jgi:chromosome segregation ATPase